MDVVVSLAEEEAENAAVALATIAACGSSFCSSAAAVWVVMAAVAAALTADANLISEKGSGVQHSVPFSLFSKIENLINTLQKIHRRQILPCRPLSD